MNAHREIPPAAPRARCLFWSCCTVAPSALHAAAKKKTVHRVIPATTQDEDAAPVDLGPVDPNRPPNVQARGVIVIDARTGQTLYEKNADEPRQIASTTKLMTALLITESGHLSDEVTVEPIDTICEPTKLYFKPGEHYARGALLYALLVHSCNDVARCLARDNAGSIESFANRMTARAASLGAVNTRFVNPNGLPAPGEDQHSTARDLSKIARVVYGNPTLRPIMATQHLQFQYARRQDGRVRQHEQGAPAFPALQRHEDRLHRRRRALPGFQRGRRQPRGHQRLPGRQPANLERFPAPADLGARRQRQRPSAAANSEVECRMQKSELGR